MHNYCSTNSHKIVIHALFFFFKPSYEERNNTCHPCASISPKTKDGGNFAPQGTSTPAPCKYLNRNSESDISIISADEIQKKYVH